MDDLRRKIEADLDNGYDDPMEARLASMLLNGWRYEDDWYDPSRLLTMLRAAGFVIVPLDRLAAAESQREALDVVDLLERQVNLLRHRGHEHHTARLDGIFIPLGSVLQAIDSVRSALKEQPREPGEEG